jgi:hypothetical protein
MKRRALAAYVEGVGLIAPGLPDWSSARAVFTRRASYCAARSLLPAPDSLPPAERRRASRLVKLALGVAAQAVADAAVDASSLTTVFSASGGDGDNCHSLCETLASADRQISPTRFHNSVHNAAAGYWSIASGAHGPCQVLCGFDASFAMGLLEALVQIGTGAPRVMLVVYDIEYPEPINSARPILDAGGIALVLAALPSARAVAHVTGTLGEAEFTSMGDRELERQRLGNPALRGLPLLEALARKGSAAVALEYLAPLALVVEVAPC